MYDKAISHIQGKEVASGVLSLDCSSIGGVEWFSSVTRGSDRYSGRHPFQLERGLEDVYPVPDPLEKLFGVVLGWAKGKN
jgi:hypothetical protein